MRPDACGRKLPSEPVGFSASPISLRELRTPATPPSTGTGVITFLMG
jgi:hypothetical protein